MTINTTNLIVLLGASSVEKAGDSIGSGRI